MGQLEKLFTRYDKLVIFDTETTGLLYDKDEIIEFSAVVLRQSNGQAIIETEYDELISLSPGKSVPAQIQQLTGISDLDLQARGIPKTRVCQDIASLFRGERTALLAYNAHFDLSFLFYMLWRDGDPTVLQGKDKLDLLTIYKDRHSYPHKLEAAINAYGLQNQVQNSHRAIDDVKATAAVLLAMEAEKDDLEQYLNLFGYHPKYGIQGKPISSVTYKPQYFNPKQPLYL